MVSQFRVISLIDSGCTGSCIDIGLVQRQKIPTQKLPVPQPVYNADGTLNAAGKITEFVNIRMTIMDHSEQIQLSVTKLGNPELFLGLDWLRSHNPSIDWSEARLSFDRCPDSCGYVAKLQDIETDEPDAFATDLDFQNDENEYHTRSMMYWEGPEGLHVNTLGPSDESKTEQVNKYVHLYPDVFSEEEFDQLPDRRPWDHAIELKPEFKPVDCKVYPLNPAEQKALDSFLEDNLKTGRIRPSKSPMASPFFFIKKKDGGLRPVQDYRKLNEMTIKNRYPLPLIQELMDTLKQARVYTKMDVRWGYNNIRIKEGDEWKVAFRTNKGLFEPTVMFFGLTNSPATFQTFMNHILKDLINEGRVIVYLDEILVFTDTREEHRKLV